MSTQPATQRIQHTVDIGAGHISRDRRDLIVTYALGSCVGVTAYDPVAGIGGMIHCQLPLSKANPARAAQNPFLFTDTGVATLLQKAFDLGAKRENLIIKVAGGANLLDDVGLFNIGERNYTVLRKILWKNNILIQSEDVGGTASRTLSLYLDTGRTTVKSGGKEVEI